MVHVHTEEIEPTKAATRRPLGPEDRSFLSKWILSCVIGFLLVFVVAGRVTYTTFIEGVAPHTAYGNDNALGPILAFTILVTLTLAPTLALCQLYAIYHVRRILNLKLWAFSVLISAVISALITVVTMLVASAAVFTLADCLLGPGGLLLAVPSGPGPGPWLFVLRHRRDEVGEIGASWLVRSMFAWPVVIVFSVLSGMLSPSIYKYPFNDPISMIYWGVGWTVGAALYGIYTGLALLPLICPSGFKANSRVPDSEIVSPPEEEPI
jgi:hypothetical protein